jgi:hypothetical protein
VLMSFALHYTLLRVDISMANLSSIPTRVSASRELRSISTAGNVLLACSHDKGPARRIHSRMPPE